MLKDLMPAALTALGWIDRYGDLDGDALVEYRLRSPKGLTNQGWKDAWDANMHCDGSVADTPIAPVEVQGYMYNAKYRMASVLRHCGNSHRADRRKREASDTLKRIDRNFWMPQRRYFAMRLDAGKRPVAGNQLQCRTSAALQPRYQPRAGAFCRCRNDVRRAVLGLRTELCRGRNASSVR